MSRKGAIFLWMGRILMAALFVMAGTHKLAGDLMMVDMFGKIGLGQGFRFVTGSLEVIAAALLVWPRGSFLGALLGLCIIAGAFIVQLLVLHGDVIHVLVAAAILAALCWFQKPVRRLTSSWAGLRHPDHAMLESVNQETIYKDD